MFSLNCTSYEHIKRTAPYTFYTTMTPAPYPNHGVLNVPSGEVEFVALTVLMLHKSLVILFPLSFCSSRNHYFEVHVIPRRFLTKQIVVILR